MNPFIPIFIVLGITVVLSHLTGNIFPEVTGILSIILFIKEYMVYRDLKAAEPEFLEGVTERIVFLIYDGSFRIRMLLAQLFGLMSVIATIIQTYGVLKL